MAKARRTKARQGKVKVKEWHDENKSWHDKVKYSQDICSIRLVRLSHGQQVASMALEQNSVKGPRLGTMPAMGAYNN